MKNIGLKGAKILPKNIVYFGVRDTEEAEDKQIEKYKIKNYKVDEIRYRGLNTCVKEALDKLSNCDILYLSFDVDSMDCDLISYGTGTPVPRGFDQREIIAIMDRIIETNKVVCIEFVEINPLLDNKGNKMAETAFEVLEHITATIILPKE
jgi:arginase